MENEYILEIENLSKSFGKNHVLKDINLKVKKGTVMGLMGENGAGKSTMMKCLFGIYDRDDGSIVFDGRPVNFSGPKDALENGVAMVHQELNQCLDRTVLDNMWLGKYPTKGGFVDERYMLIIEHRYSKIIQPSASCIPFCGHNHTYIMRTNSLGNMFSRNRMQASRRTGNHPLTGRIGCDGRQRLLHYFPNFNICNRE